MKPYVPPFSLTAEILSLSEQISCALGQLEGLKLLQPSVKLRRSNQIKTIHASLGIEGNSLSIEQITDILENRLVLGPSKDILEVKNAVLVYTDLQRFNPCNLKDLLKAHQILMRGLVDNPGRLRAQGVGILQGDHVVHMAPPAKQLLRLIEQLFQFINQANQFSWAIKSCIFHYEFEFIHPFIDGNGRMGRLW